MREKINFMINLKATICYDGSRYTGWQIQKNSNHTIQQKIEEVLTEVLGEKIEIIASGRTDAGVHAMGQVINFRTNSEIPLPELRDKINFALPSDISFKKLKKESDRFHARYNVASKIYMFRILNSDTPNPFLRKYTYFYPHEINISAMEEAAKYFVGTHDFQAFTNAKKTKKSTVRTIHSIEIKKFNNEVQVFVRGDGFLHNMVRIIVGTLFEVSEGKRNAQDIEKLFSSGKRSESGYMVPPHGLFLYEVFYK